MNLWQLVFLFLDTLQLAAGSFIKLSYEKIFRVRYQGTAVEATVVQELNQNSFPNLPDGRQELPVPMNEVISGAVIVFGPAPMNIGGSYFVIFFVVHPDYFGREAKK